MQCSSSNVNGWMRHAEVSVLPLSNVQKLCHRSKLEPIQLRQSHSSLHNGFATIYKAMHWDCGSICSHPPSLTKVPECQWFAIHLCTSIKWNIDIHKRTRGKFIFVGCLFCCSHSFFCIRCCHDGLLCSSPSLAECLPCKQMWQRHHSLFRIW